MENKARSDLPWSKQKMFGEQLNKTNVAKK